MDRYVKARTVSVPTISRELGWTLDSTKNRLTNHAWLLRGLRQPRGKYDATVIDVLRNLYVQPADDNDFLNKYLKGDHK